MISVVPKGPTPGSEKGGPFVAKQLKTAWFVIRSNQPSQAHNRCAAMSHIYNRIPLIEEAALSLSALQIFVLPQLKSLLVKYHLEFDFGIVLVHRHFNLNNVEEQVVDVKGPGTLVSSVFSRGRPDPEIVRDYNLEVPDPFAVVPAKFLVRDTLIPYEYKCVPKDQEVLYSSRTKNLPQSFLKEWFIILGKYYAQDKLGLVDMLTEEDIDGFEWSDSARRLNIVTTRTDFGKHVNYIPTLWQSHANSTPARKCACGGRQPENLYVCVAG